MCESLLLGGINTTGKQPVNDTKGEGKSPTPPLTPPPLTGFSLKRLSGAHCQVMDSSSEILQQQRPSVVISNSIHSHAIISLARVSQCKSACVHMWVSMWMKKSEQGPEKAAVSVGTTRSWCRDWLYKQTFTTLGVWLQHSPTGDTECGTRTDWTYEQSTSASFHFDSEMVAQAEHFWPTGLLWAWRWMSGLDVVFLNCRVKSSRASVQNVLR